ncbi:MAG: thioredoxin family protein [Myxococcota bacterium]|nr:thioredoxin family protein [Myxococcota bacterium]
MGHRRITIFALIIMLLVSGVALSKGLVYSKFIHRTGKSTLPGLFRVELNHAKAKGKHAVVVFTADWCTPCQALKSFLDESPTVQREARGGHFLFIDVDEWRGPAHRLIPDINPRKLPTVVRVDYNGKAVHQCFGTDLGLLSEEATGKNLARLVKGQAPQRPAYESDPALRRELLKRQAVRRKATAAGVRPVQVDVQGAPTGSGPVKTWTLKITITNPDARRKWFILQADLNQPLSESPLIDSFEVRKFDEHVRATTVRYYGQPGFFLLPLGGQGQAVLEGWKVSGMGTPKSYQVAELSSLRIDGTKARFAKKVPYVLNLKRSSDSKVVHSGDAVQLEMRFKKVYDQPLR